MKLGVNIDHIAVLREAREINDPNPLDALPILKRAGADQITIHLREDRRHIQDIDVKNILSIATIPVNLECSIAPEMIDIACGVKPHRVTLVPEKREEITTEGGLDLISNQVKLKEAIDKLQESDIQVSLFIDPTDENINISKDLGVEWIELHTGKYANLYATLYSNLSNTHHKIEQFSHFSREELLILLDEEFTKIRTMSSEAYRQDIRVAVGHGLNYENVKRIAKIPEIIELNIGQSIIARSIFTGLEQAILDLKALIKR